MIKDKKKSRKESFYDGKAVNYMPKQRGILGFLRDTLSVYEKHRHDACIELIPKKTNLLLDIGSHDGIALIKALKRIKGKAVGFDLSIKAINEARKNIRKEKLQDRAQLIKGDVDDKLPFDDNTFDAVLCIAVLEHIFDPLFVLSEISRVTKPGGILVVEVPNIAFLPRRLMLLIGKRPRTSWGYGWDGGHLQYFTMSDTVNLLQDFGFEVKVKTGSGIFNSCRRLWPSLLFANIIVSGVKEKTAPSKKI